MATPTSLNLTNSPKPKTRKGGRVPPLDWAATHGPISGALSAATGAGALALLGAATGMPPIVPLAVGAAGALGHGIGHSIHRRFTGRTIATRAASWLLAGGWTTWAIATGPLSWAAAGTLAGIGVGIGAMASNAALHEEAVEEERLSAEAKAAAAEMNGKRLAIAQEWETRIKAVTSIAVRVFAVEMWATGAGFTIAAELPGGGGTWDRIQAHSRALAADARLPLGCTVGVEEGDKQGRVVLDICTVNVMVGRHRYPDDFAALSILTGIPWGMLPNSDPVWVFLREACALILGPPGSGKSTFIDAVIAGFARCTDVLVWVIDLKAGAVGIPWCRPWLEARGLKAPKDGVTPVPAGTRPGVDWLASTPEEALLMVEAALAINEARQRAYQDLMDEHDTTLLPISAQIPQIEIVIDEGAELLSGQGPRTEVMKALRAGVFKVMRTTRAMGERLVLTAVDGNMSVLGDTSVRKFSPVGAALTSGESAGNNLAKLFPSARVDTSQLNAQGAGVIGAATHNGFAPTPFKGWFTSPSFVRAAVLATNARRPALDEVSANAAGEAYARRWDDNRAGWLWAGSAAPAAGFDPVQDTAPAAPTERPARRSGGLNFGYKKAAQEANADELAARLLDEIDAKFGTTEEPPLPPRVPKRLNLSSNRSAAEPTPAPTDGGPEWLSEAIEAIRAEGPDGMKPSAVADLVKRDRKTVRAALQAAADRGQLVYRDNGPRSTYVHPDHA